MSKTVATIALDPELLERARELARQNQETVDQFVEELLRKEVAPVSKGARRTAPIRRLPTHGQGGLMPDVDLEDKDLMDRLMREP